MSWHTSDGRHKVTERPHGRPRVQSINHEPDEMAQQQFKDHTDVNKIVAKYKTTGEWTHLNTKIPQYADVSEITDFHQSMEKVVKATEAFMTLPSDIRLKFNNDPGQLLAFMQDPSNNEEAENLGLRVKAPSKMDDTNKNDLTIKNETSKKQKANTETLASSKGSTPENQE